MKEMTADAFRGMTLAEWQPCRLRIKDKVIYLEECLRLLPGKRIAARALSDDDRVFAKVFIHRGHLGAARREKRNMEQLSEAGVNVPRPLALACDETMSVLLVTWLEGGRRLEPCFHEASAVLVEFLRQLQLMYDAGYFQADLHLDNFVLAGDRIWVVDSGDIRPLPAGDLRRKAIIRNLALLCAQAKLDQAALLCDEVTKFFHLLPPEVRYLERLTRRRRNRRIAHASHKWLRDCSAVEVRPGKRETRYLDRALNADLAGLLENPGNSPLIKRGSRISVFGTDDWVIKHYRDDSLKARLKARLGIDSARRSWVMGRTMHLMGVPTPCPVAWSRRDDGTSVLVFPRVGGQRFSDMLHEERDRAGRLAQGIWRWIGLLGMAGFWHGDMKAQNILLPDERPCFIDLDAAGWSACRLKSGPRHRRDVKRFRHNWAQFRSSRKTAGTTPGNEIKEE